jgi:glutamyl-tRNA synthetase
MPFAIEQGISFEGDQAIDGPDFVKVVDLLKARANTLIEIAKDATLFYMPIPKHDLQSEEFKSIVPETIQPAIKDFIELIQQTDGTKAAFASVMKTVLGKYGIKMPALAMPIRYVMFATTHTPAIDAVMEILGIEEVVKRLSFN